MGVLKDHHKLLRSKQLKYKHYFLKLLLKRSQFLKTLLLEFPVEFLNNPVEADIYLLDIIMPEMDGLTAIEKVDGKVDNSTI